MSDSVLFAGRTRVAPGVFTDIRTRSTVGKRSTVPDVIALLGTAEGGQPQTVLRFTDPNTARDMLRKGNLLDACEMAWSASGGSPAANAIIAIRVTPAVQGTIAANSLAASPVMTVTTRDWGAWVNNIRIKVENGSRHVDAAWSGLINNVADITSGATTIDFDTGVGVLQTNGVLLIGSEYIQYTGKTGTDVAGTFTGCKRGVYLARGGPAAAHLNNVAITLIDLPGTVKVTVENQLDPGVFEVGNNLGEGVTLRYTGAGTPALVTVTAVNGLATTVAATVTGASTDDFSFSVVLTQYDTIQKLVNAIDALPNWEASAKCPSSTPSKELESLIALEAKLDAAKPLQLMRIAHSIEDWAAGNSAYVTAAVSNNSNVAPANLAYTNFTNGSDGTENSAAWTTSLAALAPERDVLLVAPASGSLTYQALVMAHVLARRDEGMYQRMFAGSDASATVQNAIDAASSFASRFAAYFYPGVKRGGTDGVVATFGGWGSAAMAAGLTVGLSNQRSLTNTNLLAAGVEKKLTGSEIDQLILAGVAPIYTIPGQGTFIRKAVTTETGGGTFWHQQSNVGISDFIRVDLEADLNSSFIGQFISVSLLEGIRAAVAGKLQSYAESRMLFQAENAPAFRNLTVQSSGSVVAVSFEAAVSQPNDYTLITAFFTEGQPAAA